MSLQLFQHQEKMSKVPYGQNVVVAHAVAYRKKGKDVVHEQVFETAEDAQTFVDEHRPIKDVRPLKDSSWDWFCQYSKWSLKE